MHNYKPRFHSLSRRIVLLFCGFSLLLSVVFGSISFLLMYVIEDNFIEKNIEQEAQYLASAYEATGSWPEPRTRNMQLHFSRSTFPEDFRAIAIEEPRRKEFFGLEGRHFHVYQFDDYANTFLVAEVSNELMVRQIRDGVLQFLIFSGLFVSAIACLIAWFIARRITTPLKRLANLVDGVAVEQLPQRFASDYPHNEVGVLAHKLEETLQRINAAMAREKAFTQDASHELRTPLAVIKNAIELCLQYPDVEQNKAALVRVLDSADQMEKTVAALLMLAREQHAKTPTQSIELMPCVERSVLDNAVLLNNKPVEVQVDESCNTRVSADYNMLKVVLDNLLSNAFKYTERGEVCIAVRDHCIVVEDTGNGIEEDISGRETLAGVKGAQSTGFGFGLSIVKRLCEHQGWQLRVTSGQGTKVSVVLNPS